MSYRLKDTQIAGRYFADGATFETKEEIREQLLLYHSPDLEEGLRDCSLNDILEIGGWKIEEILKLGTKMKTIAMGESESGDDLKAGDRVLIFEDPITKRRVEGEATLVKKARERRTEPNGLEYWTVHFKEDDDGANYDRWTNKGDRIL